MDMVGPVMEGAGATPPVLLRANASYTSEDTLLTRGREAAWAGRKYFTLDIRCAGTEQPVCDREPPDTQTRTHPSAGPYACDHVKAITRELFALSV